MTIILHNRQSVYKHIFLQKKKTAVLITASVSPNRTILQSQIRVCRSNSSDRNVLVHPQGLHSSSPQICRAAQAHSACLHQRRFAGSQNRLTSRLCPFGFEPHLILRSEKRCPKDIVFCCGTPTGARTLDTLIKSQVLYQLS